MSKLVPGVYKFKLTVTDSAHNSDSAQVTVLVLTLEESEREYYFYLALHSYTPRLIPFYK